MYSFRGDFEMEFEIQLTSAQDVQDFVALATAQPYAVSVGNIRHWVNGKSFMEMFCLDLTFPLTVRPECSPQEFEGFRKAAHRFAVK
mgnify:CR=1 FL=1